MKEIVLNSYDKTKNVLVANILQGFCDEIYNIHESDPETAIHIMSWGELSEVIYDVIITREIMKYSIKNDASGINKNDLKDEILHWHLEHIIELVFKNINQDENQDPVYWKLKVTVV
ncbi:hypothetical protein [Pectobacterium parmentieri]|uniref:Uncharacterized protein n=1 Tax=Pectobacterium parmentieri TaxID=1905730 RepID=A0A8B3FBH7_PECPM|nr:hypothetical protein [Pectobacterium parmentieri]AOR59264.1 hypothetical protein A8F97_10105 [Pectobacterium parmentieri]AYH09722.1 hypothetical protein C5E24_08530 [Pectobacterium parmentieri]AYH19569.1 hypothetical protein C5E22_14270 [Pectobacterium parmentieri]AYH36042.1 hypothetical protein C5E17_08480 [Pectobacterium parmentieri]AZS56146.1 hypothetical protein C5E18_08475 [Pectobacterium parmentieri]